MVRLVIAIIPARSGSKRLPNKNTMELMGKPMIAWTIEAALQSQIFDRVLVSTDSAEIAELAERHGASVPFLRTAAYDDETPVSVATCVALEQYGKEFGETPDTVVQLMATCPLRTSKDIEEAAREFGEHDAPAQISCSPFGFFNPWWAFQLDEQNRPTAIFPSATLKRSQDLPPLFCPSGAIWIARSQALLTHRTFYCPGHVFFPMSWQSGLDIDEKADFDMAECLLALRGRNP
jgi:N-acylneuraminate cytidylyltransferase